VFHSVLSLIGFLFTPLSSLVLQRLGAYAQTGSVRRSQADAFNPMRFVNDVAGQVQLLIVYGKRQVVKSSGEM
jgi:hypothetical protein